MRGESSNKRGGSSQFGVAPGMVIRLWSDVLPKCQSRWRLTRVVINGGVVRSQA